MIDLTQMPEYLYDDMCRTILAETQKAFQDPEFQAKFEVWKREKETIEEKQRNK